MSRVLNINDFRRWCACFNPTDKIPEDWSGDYDFFIKEARLLFTDKVWALARREIIGENGVRKFIHYLLKELKDEVFDKDAEHLLTGKKKDFRRLYREQWSRIEETQDEKKKEKFLILAHAFNPMSELAVNGVAERVKNLIDQKKALEELLKLAKKDGE